MKREFEDRTVREVPKCKECKSDKYVGLSTYLLNKEGTLTEKYWECYKCNCVIRKARD
jgi:hypothetical protein